MELEMERIKDGMWSVEMKREKEERKTREEVKLEEHF